MSASAPDSGRMATMQRTDASGQEETHAPQRDPCKKERPPWVSLRTNRMFDLGSCALGFFSREAASDSVEHGDLSLLNRCDCIVDGEDASSSSSWEYSQRV